jgi:hypothetical protein
MIRARDWGRGTAQHKKQVSLARERRRREQEKETELGALRGVVVACERYLSRSVGRCMATANDGQCCELRAPLRCKAELGAPRKNGGVSRSPLAPDLRRTIASDCPLSLSVLFPDRHCVVLLLAGCWRDGWAQVMSLTAARNDGQTGIRDELGFPPSQPRTPHKPKERERD